MNMTPSWTGTEMIRLLRRFGFVVVRIKGSHHFVRHPDGRATVVPVHKGETLGKGLLGQILNDCQLAREDLHK